MIISGGIEDIREFIRIGKQRSLYSTSVNCKKCNMEVCMCSVLECCPEIIAGLRSENFCYGLTMWNVNMDRITQSETATVEELIPLNNRIMITNKLMQYNETDEQFLYFIRYASNRYNQEEIPSTSRNLKFNIIKFDVFNNWEDDTANERNLDNSIALAYYFGLVMNKGYSVYFYNYRNLVNMLPDIVCVDKELSREEELHLEYGFRGTNDKFHSLEPF